MTGDLVSLYAHHRGKASDKWASYLEVYDRAFEAMRDQSVRLLEIGVQNGGSLEIWAKYFPNAVSIIGCDIDPRVGALRFDDGRIGVVVGDATDGAVAAQIFDLCPAFDVIIDDGSHKSGDIVRAFLLYFERLAPGGIYVVEDLACSYWQAYEGGLFAPAAAMQFFKRLADYLNREAWGVEPDVAGFFAPWDLSVASHQHLIDAVASIEFHPSLCIIRKAVTMPVGVGVRVVAGDQFLVSDAIRGLAGQYLAAPSQSDNPYSRPAKIDALGPVALPLIQIYLASEQEGFGEAHSAREKLALDGRRQVLNVRLPVGKATVTHLRLDPANQPCVIRLHGLRLVDGQDNALWRWNSQPEAFRNVFGCELRPAADGVVVVCYNDDPQFELAIPPEVLAKAGPGSVLTVELTAYPLLDALPEVLHEAASPPALAVEARGAGLPATLPRELAETAALFKQVVERRNATIEALRAENAVLKERQQALEARLVRAEAQLEVLKEFTLSAFGKGIERI